MIVKLVDVELHFARQGALKLRKAAMGCLNLQTPPPRGVLTHFSEFEGSAAATTPQVRLLLSLLSGPSCAKFDCH